MGRADEGYLIGLDVGSTTVKAVVVDPATDRMVWSDYRRHETRQAETTLEFLRRIESDLPIGPGDCRLFITGSGGGSLAPLVGGKFVQEVTAVSLAVEKLHPEVHSVIELGGQDAKIIIFKEDPDSGRKRKIPSMNDKCAGGTGAVIDKINAKLKIPAAALADQGYHGIKVHRVAGKCGVFAETDINSLQKAGTPPDELMASLFDAIVLQNLSVLTRGHTLQPHVLLLGGPNTFIRGMREAWEHNIPRTWAERGVELPEGVDPASLIRTPEHAQYFAAIGAVEFGTDEEPSVGRYLGTAGLAHYLDVGRQAEKARAGSAGLSASPDELAEFIARYRPTPFTPADIDPGDTVRGLIGLDGGSTSTKAVLLSPEGEVLLKAYQLSNGNPIQDTIEVFDTLRGQVEDRGASLEVLGVATTGYAKDILRDVLAADAALVETVAHTESAMKYYDDPHVIVDVGGQDIKLIVLKDGRVKDFKLNTQCSAGNGYFLQSTAEGFGVPVEQFAERAFAAQAMPVFGYGCAVFMQSDIVNFQRQGWAAEEILAGLAAVLPKNVFLYVASVPNLARLGRRFVLQGGTQRNLAAVKAEVDFIRSNFAGTGVEPEIIVHEHCGESGAIGAAVEALRLWQDGHETTFVGLDAVRHVRYRTTRNEDTRCFFCKNNCLRTFIDVEHGQAALPGPVVIDTPPRPSRSKVPLAATERRIIIATCEKGAVEDLDSMRDIKAGLDAAKASNPNLVDLAAREAWRCRTRERVAHPIPARGWTPAARRRIAAMQRRAEIRIGIPRVLNLYAYAPFFTGYLESLGVPHGRILYSDVTSAKLYREGAGRGSIDPCFPSKVANAHVHDLLARVHRKTPLDAILFPMIDVLHSPLVGTQGANGCPTATMTPEAVKAAYTKESDVFAEHGVSYLDPLVDFTDRRLLARQLWQSLGVMLGMSEEESRRAVEVGFRVLEAFETDLRRRARDVLDRLERESRLGIVLLGRPYHHDPGVNHEILDEFQKLGYPVLSQSTLPTDPDLLDRLFAEDLAAGTVDSPLSIADVWKNSTSASTNRKLWAAKFVARHPHLVALELSSFKCGHDAPVYTAIESIVERSGTPYFAFKDIDENKPTGSVRIRIETIHYFLARYRDDIIARRPAAVEIARRIETYEQELRDRIAREEALTRQRPASPDAGAGDMKVWTLRPVASCSALPAPDTA